MKKVLILAIILLIAAAGYIYKDHITSKAKVLPVTYEISDALLDLDSINESSILITGDKMASKLKRFMPEFIHEVSRNLKEPIKVADISSEDEGLHRTLAKIKQIKKLPKVVVYHGASREFFEQKFDVRDYAKIISNFKTYEDETKVSLIMTLPFLSKFLYRPTSVFYLNDEIKEDRFKYPATIKQQQMELVYKFYDLELNQLVKHVKEKGSTLVLITTPINMVLPPKRVCDNATTMSITTELDDFDIAIKEKKFKTTIPRLASYAKAAVGNSRAWHLLGTALLESGNTTGAIEAFQKAVLFDCNTWRPTSVFNSILRRKAAKYDLDLIDFAKSVHISLGRNDQFNTEDTPHDIYYNEVIDELVKVVKKIMEL